jgi:hypothetical protein
VKRRYSIWGREYGADHDVELAQVDANPEEMRKALGAKTLTIKHSIVTSSKKKSKIRKYSWLRIIDNDAPDRR